MKIRISIALCFGLLLATSGCSQQSAPTSDTAVNQDHHDHDHGHDHEGESPTISPPVAPSVEGEQYVLATEPADPQNIIAARDSVKNNDDVVLSGTIGGSENPWIEGRAIFTLVDSSLKSCNEIPGDNCPAPWDYCCETDKLPGASALIKVVNGEGEPIQTDARELLGVRELTNVVVKGKAQRDDAGNLTILATEVYVKK